MMTYNQVESLQINHQQISFNQINTIGRSRHRYMLITGMTAHTLFSSTDGLHLATSYDIANSIYM